MGIFHYRIGRKNSKNQKNIDIIIPNLLYKNTILIKTATTNYLLYLYKLTITQNNIKA